MAGGMADEDVKAEVLGFLATASLLPRLIVFDLDYTLWPFYCECRSKSDNPRLYPHAKGILNALKEKQVKMAIASRTPTPDVARVYLNKLSLTSYFMDMEIFPSWTHKTDHFKNIHQKTSIPFNSMLFFDDEDRNIQSHYYSHNVETVHEKGCAQLVSSCESAIPVEGEGSNPMWRSLPGRSHFVLRGAFVSPDKVSQMGVTSVLVDNGVNIDALREGLTKHARAEIWCSTAKRN